MITFRLLPILLAGVLFSARPTDASAGPQAADILPKLRPDHPRLFATADDFAALKPLLTHVKVAPVYSAVKAEADELLKTPPSQYEIRDGKRLLYVSREVKERVFTLALMYRLTGEAAYADRLWKEADAVAQFKDWNPPHFLDTAEMALAMGVAYDWLHERWSPEQRKTLREAIVRLGLQPALKQYRANSGFPRTKHNWNQVCNGGILTAALAVAEDEPAIAGEIVASAVASLPLAMKHFAPDGNWGEGPGYWGYATEYNVFALAALRTALGTDFGLADMPGFATTGDAPLAFTSPIGETFNYADAKPGFHGATQLYWLATAFNNADYAAFQNRYTREHGAALGLLWGAAWLAKDPQLSDRPLDRIFRSDDVVYLRSAWNDANAVFVGFKGGDNKVNHGQLDLGSFVLDALGHRWAMDIGPDDYNRPGYFGPNRWNFYRCRAEGNNCFVLNPDAEPDQSPSAEAKIEHFVSSPKRSFAIANLSAAYSRSATSARRGIALLDRQRVVVQDEVQAKSPAEYLWFMHTGAKVSISPDGTTATLEQAGKKLIARIASPVGAKFSVMEAKSLATSPAEPPAANKPQLGKRTDLAGVRKLTIRIEGATDLRVAVVFDASAAPPAPPAITPLANW